MTHPTSDRRSSSALRDRIAFPLSGNGDVATAETLLRRALRGRGAEEARRVLLGMPWTPQARAAVAQVDPTLVLDLSLRMIRVDALGRQVTRGRAARWIARVVDCVGRRLLPLVAARLRAVMTGTDDDAPRVMPLARRLLRLGRDAHALVQLAAVADDDDLGALLRGAKAALASRAMVAQ